MSGALSDFIGLNIIGAGVTVVGVILCISWSRTVRGSGPDRRKITFLIMIFLAIWILNDLAFLYLVATHHGKYGRPVTSSQFKGTMLADGLFDRSMSYHQLAFTIHTRIHPSRAEDFRDVAFFGH
jgi:hypothetical protein